MYAEREREHYQWGDVEVVNHRREMMWFQAWVPLLGYVGSQHWTSHVLLEPKQKKTKKNSPFSSWTIPKSAERNRVGYHAKCPAHGQNVFCFFR